MRISEFPDSFVFAQSFRFRNIAAGRLAKHRDDVFRGDTFGRTSDGFFKCFERDFEVSQPFLDGSTIVRGK